MTNKNSKTPTLFNRRNRNNPTRLIDEFFSDFDSVFWSPVRRSTQSSYSGGADIINRVDAYELRMDMPGVSRNDIDVSVTSDNRLVIEASRNDEIENEDSNYINYVKKQKSHSYSMKLDNSVETDDIDASLENGVLVVIMPKTNVGESENHKKIEVK